MANNKQRYINTKFWNDTYVSDLDPIEKLLFVYFLTNEHTNIAGIYELPLKIIAIETGIDESMLKKILPRLEAKIRYMDGYVVVKNFVKHQEAKSDNVKKGIENCLAEIDKKWLSKVISLGYYQAPKECLDTLGIPLIDPSNYLDLDSNLDLDSIAEPSSASLIPEVIKEFEKVNPACKKYYGNTTQRKACQNLIEEYGFAKVVEVVGFLQRSNKMPYMPTITTPVQLWDKWQALEDGLHKKKGELQMRGKGLA